MRILMFTRFSQMGANSRYRLLQYIPLFEDAGHQVEVRAMLDDAYLKVMYSSGRRSGWHTLRGYARRIAQLRSLDKYDVVICDQEFLPYFPGVAETLIAGRCRRLIVDYDDAAHFKYRRIPVLRNKIPALMAAAEAILVGNRYLSDFALQYNASVSIVPTVVDSTRYQPKLKYSTHQGVRLVWIGTPITAAFLRPIAPALDALHHKYPDLRLRLVGAGNVLREELPFAEVVEWSEAAEAKLLAECDVGLMPLPDNDFTRGKCGLKLIQYMAAGLPVVGSAVGANCDIISEGYDGYLVNEPQGWSAALERLVVNEVLRRDLGRRGVEKVKQKYSLRSGFQSWMTVLGARPQGGVSSLRPNATAVGS
ncbi:MAG: glycosyltransferase family 4 protein [Candidatus Korobacteraceae bacterium]